ncbi:NADPH-dependent FMN reductase [Cryomorpha ignava]|uniref:NADPH-dependent FMN reductase n=1 Tax=Cryomorpha ignava TaxID=101383 RepID=UPI001EF7E3AF|nr:NADPH-dependent FMN reductase [Cryomorpha ignava]
MPHFSPEISIEGTPKKVLELREAIKNSDGVLICTPEYVFSIPSGIKNAIEWCVSTTVFSSKPVGLITASASGEKGQEELQLIMKTLEASFTNRTTHLIQGVKGKVDTEGTITNLETENDIQKFANDFEEFIKYRELE